MELHGDAGVAHAPPGLAAVVRNMEPGDRAGQQEPAGQGREAGGAALLEPLLEALPFAAAVFGLVDPAAGAGPDLAGLAGHRGEAENLGVEHHPLEHAVPGLAGVVALVGAAPGAGDDGVGLVGVHPQAGDLLDLGKGARQLLPGEAAVLGAVDAAQGAGVHAARPARHQGEGVDLLVGQAAGARDPGLAPVVRHRHVAAAPDAPQGRPNSRRLVRVETESAHDPAGERQVRARVAPGAPAVLRNIELPGGGAGKGDVRVLGIEGHRPHVAAPDRKVTPVPRRGRHRTGGNREQEEYPHTSEKSGQSPVSQPSHNESQ